MNESRYEKYYPLVNPSVDGNSHDLKGVLHNYHQCHFDQREKSFLNKSEKFLSRLSVDFVSETSVK